MSTLLQDLRFALRQLFKDPGPSFTAVLSLTLGVAATTAVFSVVWAVVMNPYPFRDPDTMMHPRLATETPGRFRGFGITAEQWRQIRKAPPVADAVIIDGWNLTITGEDIPEDISGTYLSSNASGFFGVPPALGRNIQPSDSVDGADPVPVVLLGYKFWQRHYAADPSIVGKTIQMVGRPYTVIGVAGPRFVWDDADIYVPLKTTADTVHNYALELRLKPGISRAVAEQQLQPYITRFAQESPKHFPDHPGAFHLETLNERFLQEIGDTLTLLFGAVALLLAIGCANVSILLLARGTARQHEFALRAAIGASRSRIIRQLLTEALLLSVTGAALGVALAFKLTAVIVALLPPNSFPHEAVITVNLPVLVFSACIAVLTGVLFGLSPALRLSRADVREAMSNGSRKFAGSASGRATGNALVAGQIAITLLLIAAAGAAIQGFFRLTHRTLGYNPHHVMSVGIPVHDGTHRTLEDRTAFFSAVLHKVAETPGVTEAAISSGATPPNNGRNSEVDILGSPSTGLQKIRSNLVSAGYFSVLQMHLDQGRIWTEAEEAHANPVAVVNQTFARKYFPSGDAVGHSFKVSNLKADPPYVLLASGADGWIQIVGVVADKLDDGLDKPVLPETFSPYTLSENMYTQVLVRSDVEPTTLIHSIGQQVSTLDSNQQIAGHTLNLDGWISQETEYQQAALISWLFGAFAVLALALAAVGLYSVVSYTVAQRTNEFGIRMALGALRGHVVGLVFRSTGAGVAMGVAIGIGLSLLLRTVMQRWSPNSSVGALPLLGAVFTLTAVALVAGGVPARRASTIEPMQALRES